MAAPPLGRSLGVDQERVAEVVWIFEEERFEIAFGDCVSAIIAVCVVKMLSREVARLPEESRDFMR